MANKQFERCLPAGIATESREFQQNLQHCGFPDTQGQGAQQHCQQEPEFEDPGTVLGFVMQDEEPGEVLGRIEAEFLKMLQGLQEGRAEISVVSLFPCYFLQRQGEGGGFPIGQYSNPH